MNLLSRLAALERWRRPDLGSIKLVVIDNRRGHDPHVPRFTVPDVDGVLNRDSYQQWEAAQREQAHAAGRPLRIYVREWWDR